MHLQLALEAAPMGRTVLQMMMMMMAWMTCSQERRAVSRRLQTHPCARVAELVVSARLSL